MDERKLNINVPLMSVRRSSATPSSLTEAAKRNISEKKQQFLPYMTLDQVTEHVAVPFHWEHIPGRPKGNGESEPQPPKNTSITPIPNLPPGKSTNVAKQPLGKESILVNKFSSNSLSHNVGKLHCDKEQKDDERVKKLEEDDDDDNDDDVYSDALETLSPTKPFSMNCSVSGVSALENLDANKCETSSTDKQAQDFMMSSFLSAAKAMTITLQPPQYASRKQSSQAEQPRNFTNLVREEKKSFVNRHITDIVPYTGQCQEEEESDDETDDYANISAKGCGLFPSLCVKNSLCLLNQVPGTKMGNQFPMYSAFEVRKNNKSSHIHSCKSAPAIKKAWDAIHKSKLNSRDASQEVRKKWTSESNRYNTYSGEMKQQGRLSPFRSSRAVAAESIQSGRLKFLTRGYSSVHEVLSQGTKKSSNSGMGKTMYMDPADKLKLSCSSSSFGRTTQSRGNSCSFRVMKYLQVQALEENLDSEVLSNSTDNKISNLSSMLCLMDKEDKVERLTSNQEINRGTMSLQLVQSSFNKETEINNQQIVVVDDSEKINGEYAMQHPLPPPLPKSPSESWLCRALPLVSCNAKNSFVHLNQSKSQGLSRASSFTKWETIVKTSNLHHDHELTIYKSQHSKS